MKLGDSVFYHDGMTAVPAEVTSVNEDNTINLSYPHPKDPSVRAGAEFVSEGYGAFQWSHFEERAQDPAPVVAPQESNPDALGELETKLAEARSQVAQRNHTISDLRKEVTTLTEQRDNAMAAALENATAAGLYDAISAGSTERNVEFVTLFWSNLKPEAIATFLHTLTPERKAEINDKLHELRAAAGESEEAPEDDEDPEEEDDE